MMKYRLISVFFLCGAVCLAEKARGAETSSPAVYTLEDCIEAGLENSARIKTASADRAIADYLVEQARSSALPKVSLSGRYTRQDELQEVSFGEQTTEVGSLNNYSVEAGVNQLLYSGGKVRSALRAARLSRKLASSSKRETELSLVRDIRDGFYGVLLARDSVSVREDSVKQLESLVKQAEAKHKTGAGSEFNVLRAKVELANEKPALIAARAGYETALAAFRRLLGIEEEIALRGELSFVPFEGEYDDLVAEALSNRPALRRSEVAVELRKEDVSAAKAGYMPEVNAFFNYTGTKPYGFVTADDEWEWHWSTGLMLNWSLWDSGLTSGRVGEKQQELVKARTAREDLERAVKLQVKTAYLDMKHAAEAVKAGKGNVRLAEKALEIAATRLETGAGTHLEFTDANVALSTAKLGYLGAVMDHMNAVSRLKAAIGRE
ncbi:MAG: TolC family protein [Kiritimatiellia bacterium]